MLIEINLAPGAAAAKVGSRRLANLRLPTLPSFGGDIRAALGVVGGVAVLAIAGLGYMQMGARQTAVQAQIEQEVSDSVRLATTIALMRSLQARQDTILQKIDVIRSVDTRRYVWPHLLDEVSFAVPAFTWITEISSIASGEVGAGPPAFTLQGSAGSTQALTRFMKNLEGSAFIRDVTLITTEQEVVEGRTIQRFSLEARYRIPDPTVIRTTPILILD